WEAGRAYEAAAFVSYDDGIHVSAAPQSAAESVAPEDSPELWPQVLCARPPVDGAPDPNVGVQAGPAAHLDCQTVLAGTGTQSKWVHVDQGKLVYQALPTGDRIVDFSYAGYGGGGVAIPSVPVKRTVAPSGGDDTAAIQAALDAVAKLAPQNGIRG